MNSEFLRLKEAQKQQEQTKRYETKRLVKKPNNNKEDSEEGFLVEDPFEDNFKTEGVISSAGENQDDKINLQRGFEYISLFNKLDNIDLDLDSNLECSEIDNDINDINHPEYSNKKFRTVNNINSYYLNPDGHRGNLICHSHQDYHNTKVDFHPSATSDWYSGSIYDDDMLTSSQNIDLNESVKTKSKHYSKPINSRQNSAKERYLKFMNSYSKKKFSEADYFFNSYYFANEKLNRPGAKCPKEGNKTLALKFPSGKIPYRGRRTLQRTIDTAKEMSKTVLIHQSYFNGVNKQNRDESRIVDSGTTRHIGRDRDDFAAIGSEKVRIKGATGEDYGFKGILKESQLGIHVPAIWFPNLPVKMLLSTDGLTRDGWMTVFGDHKGRNYIRDLRTGKVINLTDRQGLKCAPLKFENKTADDSSGYVSQIVENGFEWDKTTTYNCDTEIPKDLSKAVVETKKTRNKKNNGKQMRSSISKLLQHQRNCHLFTEPSQRCRCFDCLEVKGRRASHAKTRPESCKIQNPFILFSCDFFGKVKPRSFRNNQWCLVFICEACQYSKAVPLQAKSDAPETLVRFVREIRQRCGCNPGTKTTSKGDIIFAGIRSDNEPVLRGKEWRRAIQTTGLHESHSVPYCPQQNGICERMVGTIKSGMATCMRNVDPRLWDFCAEHIPKVWNLRSSDKASKYLNGKERGCPDDVLQQISDNPLQKSGIARHRFLRRFGCLAYFKRDVSPEGVAHLKNNALLPRRVRGVHLGFSEKNSSWIIGSINAAGNFSVYETVDVVFVESILVRDLEKLCAWRTSLPVVETSELDLREYTVGGTAFPSDSAGWPPAGPDSECNHPGGAKDSLSSSRIIGADQGIGDPSIGESKFDPIEDLDIGSDDEKTSPENGLSDIPAPPIIDKDDEWAQQSDDSVDADKLKSQGTCLKSEYKFTKAKLLDRPIEPPTTESTSDGNVTFGPPSVPKIEKGEKKGRGRPKGTKDKTKRFRRTKEATNKAKLEQAYLLGESTTAYRPKDRLSCYFHQLQESMLSTEYSHLAMDIDDEEDTMEFEIFLAKELDYKPSKPGDSIKPTWAFGEGNPERPQWVAAKTKEQARLMSYETWRALKPEEENAWRRGEINAVPCALLLNRKRCGRFKARLVVLGNRWKPDQENSVYASVVSQTGNRAVTTHCAREGFHIIPFDISNAFVRASMGDLKVAITLPKSFRDSDNDNGRRMLQKALYGLPISPRLWAKTLAKDLCSLGWEECKSEPGVYRKWNKNKTSVDAYITVYVDDCIVGARTKDLCEKEVELINKKHPLTIIETKVDNEGTQHFDMCGADIEYNAHKRTLKISMANYIDKIVKRFFAGNENKQIKTRSIPGFPEKNLYNSKAKKSDFPFKAAVGALQWLATTARPDIAHSTNMLARAGAQPVTTSMEMCAKLVFRYLIGTREIGLQYSPKMEEEFNKVYGELAELEDNKNMPADQTKEPVHLFTDASFGVAYKSLRSITGVTVYLHGMPIAWKTKVQTIHTSSTTESEWVALADGIEFSQSVYGLQKFLVGRPELEDKRGPIWQDNRPAVINARRGPAGLDEIPKKTRHIALRYARVLEYANRIWFVPTDKQLADGLTKSIHRNPLLQIFTRKPEQMPIDENEDADEELDWSESFLCRQEHNNKRFNEHFSFCQKDLESFDTFLFTECN